MEIVENKLACGSFGDADRCSWDWVQVAMGFVPEICFWLMRCCSFSLSCSIGILHMMEIPTSLSSLSPNFESRSHICTKKKCDQYSIDVTEIMWCVGFTCISIEFFRGRHEYDLSGSRSMQLWLHIGHTGKAVCAFSCASLNEIRLKKFFHTRHKHAVCG